MQVVSKFTEKVLEKYGKHVKCVIMMGSAVRGELNPKSDIDLFLVIDDTTNEIDLQEIDENIEKIKESIPEAWKTFQVGDKKEKVCVLSVLPSFSLTEFWDYARVGHPVIYNLIKEGIPVYDSGFFAPIKRLLDMGRIPTTKEAIDNNMEGASKRLKRAKDVKLLIIAEDCYYPILESAQAVLMFIGIPPPIPRKIYDEFKKYLVDPGLIDLEYAEWLKEIIEIRKKIEHKEMLSVTGVLMDEWLARAEKFVDKMFWLLSVLEIRKREVIAKRTYEVTLNIMLNSLKTINKAPEREADLLRAFKQEFIDTGLIANYYLDVLEKVMRMNKIVEERKIEELPEKEVYVLRDLVRRFIHDLAKVLKKNDFDKQL